MAYQYFTDCKGDTVRLWDTDGRLTHTPVPFWNATTQMTSRKDDVMICTYPRSGTHWTWEIVRMLKTGDTGITPQADMKHHNLLVVPSEELDKLPSPRVLTTHRHFHELPSDFIINRRKLVLVLRDPKDVCVSWYHIHRSAQKTVECTGTFEGFVSLFLQGKVCLNSWTSWVLSFEKGLKEHPDIPYHVVHYEQLKENPVKEIRRLAEFLDVDPQIADTVADRTHFSAMREVKVKYDRPDLAVFFDDNKANEHFFRTGKSGGWKEWFTEEQATQFNDTLCQKLGHSYLQPLL